MYLPTVTVVFNWRNLTNLSGKYPIHLRLSLGIRHKYYRIEVPQKVHVSEWNGKEDGWIKDNHPYFFEINHKIREKKNICLDIIKKSYIFNKSVSLDLLMLHLNKKGDRNSFYQYMQDYIRKPTDILEEVTLKKYRTCLSHLKKYKTELYFAEIDSNFVQGFHRFMHAELNLAGAACKKYMEAFKKVVKLACKDNYMDSTILQFLFDEVKIKVPKPKRTFMDVTDILKWKQIIFPSHQSYLERDRDLFLFMIYTGYYYKYLKIFNKDHLRYEESLGHYILGERDKNGNVTIIPLYKFPFADAILTKYSSNQDGDSMMYLKNRSGNVE